MNHFEITPVPSSSPTAVAAVDQGTIVSDDEQHIQILQIECHYVALALEKVRKHSREWLFLETKLITAEKELETLRIKAALSVNEGLCSNAAMDESVSSDATNFVEYDVPASERAHTDSLVEEDSIHLDSDSDEDGDSLDDSERSSQDMSCDNDRLNGGNGQVEEIRKQLEELYSQHQKLRTCASTASTCSSETKHPVNWDTHEGDGSIGGSRYSNVLAYPFHDTRTASTCSSETKRQVNWGTCEGDDSIRGSRHNIALSCPSNDTSDGEDKPSILKKGTLLRWQQSQSNAPSSYLHDIKKPNKRQKSIITCLLIFLIGGAFVFLFTYFYNGKNSQVKESNQDEARMNYKNPNSVSARNSLEPAPKPCATFSMNLITDQFGNETTWELLSLDESNDANISYIYDGSELRVKDEVQGKHKEGGQRRFLRSKQRVIRSTKGDVIMSRGPYSYHEEFDRGATGDEYQMIDADICLPVGKYQFIIYDTEGDGICCFYGHGQYGLHFPGGREVRPLSSGQFLGASEMTEFEVTNADINLANSTEESQQQTGNDAGLPNIYDVDSLTSFATASGNDLATVSLSKAFGIMFDVEMRSNVTSPVVAGMDLYLDTTSSTQYEVWAKPGSWQNVDKKNPEYFKGFHQVSHGTIEGKGMCTTNSIKSCAFSTIPIQDFQDVTLANGGARRAAFYVTLNTDSMLLQNREASSKNEMANIIQSSNAEIQVLYGVGVLTYPLQFADPVTDFHKNKGFLGRLWYKEVSKA